MNEYLIMFLIVIAGTIVASFLFILFVAMFVHFATRESHEEEDDDVNELVKHLKEAFPGQIHEWNGGITYERG